jgi:hypothetical protein
METQVTRAELRWVLVASVIVLLFASLPTLYAWSLADDEQVFTGFVFNTEDGNSYIAKMRLGARGEWLFRLVYTPEEHQGALVYTFYLLLGKIAAGMGFSCVLTYHLARVFLGLGLLLTVYVFLSRFTEEVVTRRLAWALVAVGSGLGWLLTTLGATNWLSSLPLDFWVPEAYVFLVLYSVPHLALAESLLLWAVLWALRAFDGDGVRWCLGAGLAACLMAWILPFYAGILAAVLGTYLLALALRRRGVPWRETGLAALVGVLALAPVVYSAWVFTANPAFGVWAAQNRIRSPHPLHFLLGYALLLVPGVWGGIQAVRSRDDVWLLPVAWVLVVPLLLYLPVNLQRRMIAAVQVPLALLAALGLRAWLGERRWVLTAYVAIASLSNALLVVGSLGPIGQRAMPAYRPGGEVAALAWLAGHTEADDVILASFEVGNVIPARTDLRVFAGHGPETLHSAAKQETIRRFFQPDAADAWRQALLRQFELDYVFHGPSERALGEWEPGMASYLTMIYDEPPYTIYRVEVGP